ncbi:MAG: tRNA 2-thiouridine(34) synthase MnmA [Planctomycetales bacterium]|nr:tRNA 2-thiouridine(34) synthase MnmA [Planctomycetales bacterium]
MARVVLAMSGGVDSSVAAHLLVEAGHEVIGVFMRHGHESPAACAATTSPTSLPVLGAADRLDHKQGCCTAADAADARRVADRLGLPFYALNLDAEFQQIIDYFVAEYAAGRTPNPCVQCNNWIKFGKLFDYADSVGAEYVATGHYARIEKDSQGRTSILRGVDDSKDQSYVLFGIERELLDRMMLPIGEYCKSEIRTRAGELGLAVADKQDSQEICFVTRGRYDEFVRQRLPDAEDRHGEFVLTDGTVVGNHRGVEGFTVGQRKGLGIALGKPAFVVEIDAQSRRVVLGDREALARDGLVAHRCNWLVDSDSLPSRCEVQIRYNAAPAPAEITLQDDQLLVRFLTPQLGVAPGQAAVCYHEGRVLGGGWIAESH